MKRKHSGGLNEKVSERKTPRIIETNSEYDYSSTYDIDDDGLISRKKKIPKGFGLSSLKPKQKKLIIIDSEEMSMKSVFVICLEEDSRAVKSQTPRLSVSGAKRVSGSDDNDHPAPILPIQGLQFSDSDTDMGEDIE